MDVLLVNPPARALPESATSILSDFDCAITRSSGFEEALLTLRENEFDAVMVCAPGEDASPQTVADCQRLMKAADAKHVAGVVFSDASPNGSTKRNGANGSLLETVGFDVSADELRGRLSMIERYHALLRKTERELRNMERLGKRLNQHFREVDQEMRLAGRLQHDFLPRICGPINGLRFTTLFRPASWVSGDIFDVIPIDDRHTAIYVADAVGHGMAAGLLTMFIKRTIQPVEHTASGRHILSPTEVMERLNNALADQELPNCQFVTAAYLLIDHETRKVSCARGGHTYPMHISASGEVTELKTSGGLLGLFGGGEFPTVEAELAPGDKMLIYTDGVELAFQPEGAEEIDPQSYHKVFASLAPLPIDKMISRIEKMLDDEQGSLNPRDDITLLGFEVTRDALAPARGDTGAAGTPIPVAAAG